MTKADLKRIEIALDIELYDWQRAYLLDEPYKIQIQDFGRCKGHTTAYIIKLLMESNEILDIRNFDNACNVSDWWSVRRTQVCYKDIDTYTSFFRNELKKIYCKLKIAGIQIRKVYF